MSKYFLLLLFTFLTIISCKEEVDPRMNVYNTFEIQAVDENGKVLENHQTEFTSTLEFTEAGEMFLVEGPVKREGTFELTKDAETLITDMEQRKDTFSIKDLTPDGMTLVVTGGQRIVLKAKEPIQTIR